MPWYTKQPFANMSANFCEIATHELHKYSSSQRIMSPSTFEQLFGLTPSTVQIIHFLYLFPTHLFQPKYLLWSLYFLKHYPLNSAAHLPFVDTNEKTFRLMVWETLKYLGGVMDELGEIEKDDVVVVDATECHISRPTISWVQRACHSGYKKKTTLKYEVTVSAKTGKPVYWNGPFPGPTADITIFRSGLKEEMREVTTGLADGTYQGEMWFLEVPPRPYKNLTPQQRAYHRRLSKRRIIVENFIGRLKSFKALVSCWRHDISLHKIIFKVVLNCVAIDLCFRPLRC